MEEAAVLEACLLDNAAEDRKDQKELAEIVQESPELPEPGQPEFEQRTLERQDFKTIADLNKELGLILKAGFTIHKGEDYLGYMRPLMGRSVKTTCKSHAPLYYLYDVRTVGLHHRHRRDVALACSWCALRSR